ncbi:MAG: thermonuclease family protein [Chloroflexi bacterium]|nr:thermonuclease family protein [Chloroflexota bacterium]
MARVLAVVALLLLAAACAQPSGAPSPSTGTATTPDPTGATLEPSSSPTPVGLEEAIVINVVDGDTIDVLIDGRKLRVRYIGIDTPETVDPRRPVECFGREASERNRELVEGMTVGLERDVSETDQFGRLLRYVWANGEMVNAALVEEGYASASAFPPDVRYAELFAALETQARADNRGLWGTACATPAAPQPATGAECDYSDTSEPVIKGNISLNTGEKIYHVPDGEFYDQTVISEDKGERWFCSEAGAVAAGWRKSKR